MFKNKKALLLDMNSTFMFGEDRFGEDEDFSVYYNSIKGKLPKDKLTHIIRAAYNYLDERYPEEKHRHCFPSLQEAIEKTLDIELSEEEKNKVIDHCCPIVANHKANLI